MAEPATDEQLAAMRAYLKAEGSPKRWSRHAVAILIARIDAERAAREKAEARVKVLKGALSAIERWELPKLPDGKSFAFEYGSQGERQHICSIARAALKEPANG